MTRDNIQSYQDEFALWREERKELERLLSADNLSQDDIRALQSLGRVYDRCLRDIRAQLVQDMLDDINAETRAKINEFLPQN